MANLISDGLPNPNHYLIGRGVLYAAETNSSGFPLAWRDLGNAPEFSMNVESERQEHLSSRVSVRSVDKEVPIQTTATLSVTLDEPNFDNLALYLQGNTARAAQAATAVLGEENVVLSTTEATRPELALGRWYDLYVRADMSTGAAYPGNAADERVYKLNTGSVPVVSIGSGQPGSASPALTVNVDFAVDYELGRIFIYDTAATRVLFVSGATLINPKLDVDFTPTAGFIEEVQGLTQTAVTVALKYAGVNAANSNYVIEAQFHAVTLTADGDFSIIGDDFATMALTGKAEARPAVDAASPVVRIRSYSAT